MSDLQELAQASLTTIRGIVRGIEYVAKEALESGPSGVKELNEALAILGTIETETSRINYYAKSVASGSTKTRDDLTTSSPLASPRFRRRRVDYRQLHR